MWKMWTWLCESMWKMCVWLCAPMWKMCDLTKVMKCECYVFDLVINWSCEYLLYPWDDYFRACLIYLINWMIIHVNMMLLKMNMCLYDVMIIVLYMCSYLLYVERISYTPVVVWSPTSPWCRRAGCGCLVDVSSRGRLSAYSPFYVFDLRSRVWWCSD